MLNLTYTIGEVAALLGITPKTIKYYHKINLLPEPERDTSNYRCYDMTHILQLQQILRLKSFGLSLKQIEIIIKSDDPDHLVQVVLRQYTNNLRDEIARLQHQLEAAQDFLQTGETLAQLIEPQKPPVSSLTALSDAIKTSSSGISDILVEIERDVMIKLDQFGWDANYELFWYLVGKRLVDTLTNESLFIFWMERYAALANMDVDDLQGAAWLKELHHSSARHMLRSMLMPSPFPVLPENDQQQILKLLPSLLYHEGSLLQKQFLMLLVKR